MKKETLFVFLFLLTVVVWAQDKAQVTVQKSQTVNGVVLVTITENGKELELQCTAEQAWCTAVKPGPYQMVRLAKNHGMYDCQNVDLFASDADIATADKLGEYCLNQP